MSTAASTQIPRSRFLEVYALVDRYIESRYGVVSTVGDVLDPNTGDFDGSKITVDYTLDPEQAVFVLLHLFGHTVQWNVSEEFRRLGQETVSKITDEQIAKVWTYERDATRFSIQVLHECGIFDLDRWASDWWYADWKCLLHFYRTGEPPDQKRVSESIVPGEADLLAPLAIPEFTPTRTVSRWAFAF